MCIQGLRATQEVAPKGQQMCEFKVFLAGRLLLEDVVYAKVEGRDLVLRDVLGIQKTLTGLRIVQVDVSAERLVLAEGSSP